MSDLATKRSIVILTGAGISAESGIKTFRAADGLWEEHRIEDVASPEGFRRNPALVQQFYNMRRQQLKEVSVAPNAAHKSLAELQQAYKGECLLVTQNVDDLHQRAGAKNVRAMHGQLRKAFCEQCFYEQEQYSDLNIDDSCPQCGEIGTLRPDIVWFGEMPKYMDEIYTALERCDLFLAIGTSGNVYPAAGFVQAAKQAGAYTIEVNLESASNSRYFDESRIGMASKMVPHLVKEILGKEA